MPTETIDELVAEVAMSFSDNSSPTSAEQLAAFYRIARAAYAMGVVAGNAQTAQVMNRVMLAMSQP